MKLASCVEEYLVECEINKFSPRTLKSYKNTLNVFVRYCTEEKNITDMEDVDILVVRSFIKFFVSKGRKGSYINSLLKVIKVFIQWSYTELGVGFDTKKHKFSYCKEEKPLILTFKPKDVKTLLSSCGGNDFLSIRDATILTMFFETGVRCIELISLKKEDIFDDYIIINGKGNKVRVVPITPPLKKALLRYERAKDNYFALKDIDEEYFLSFHGKKLNNSAVEKIFKKRGSAIENVRVSPHTARHFFAQTQLKMGTDVYSISRLLGHENIKITQVYLRSLTNEDLISKSKNRSVLMYL